MLLLALTIFVNLEATHVLVVVARWVPQARQINNRIDLLIKGLEFLVELVDLLGSDGLGWIYQVILISFFIFF